MDRRTLNLELEDHVLDQSDYFQWAGVLLIFSHICITACGSYSAQLPSLGSLPTHPSSLPPVSLFSSFLPLPSLFPSLPPNLHLPLPPSFLLSLSSLSVYIQILSYTPEKTCSILLFPPPPLVCLPLFRLLPPRPFLLSP